MYSTILLIAMISFLLIWGAPFRTTPVKNNLAKQDK
jgi:hypothetical protein